MVGPVPCWFLTPATKRRSASSTERRPKSASAKARSRGSWHWLGVQSPFAQLGCYLRWGDVIRLNRTRHALGEGFPRSLFRLQGGFTFSPWRTVGIEIERAP